MKFLLKLRHWQLFLILILFFIIELQFTGKMYNLLMALWFLIYTGWIHIIAVTLFLKLPVDHKLKILPFKICMFIATSYVIISMFYYNEYQPIAKSTNGIFLSLYFLVVALSYYAIYFTGKVLGSVVEGRILKFKECIPYFLAFLFYFIGVWYIQPKVNKLTDEN